MTKHAILTGKKQLKGDKILYDVTFVDDSGDGYIPVDPGFWLSGHGAPGSGPQVGTPDEENAPWNWVQALGGWISPAYEVTWEDGAILPAPESTELAGVHVMVIAGPTLGASIYESTEELADTAVGSGSGVAMVVQYENDFGHTSVPDIDIPFDQSTFGDFIIGAEHVWPSVSTGTDGQFYLDLDTRDLYGPRTNGNWSKIATLPPPS